MMNGFGRERVYASVITLSLVWLRPISARSPRRALAARGIQANEVELIVVATVTPDMLFPSTACLIQGSHRRYPCLGI